MAPDMTEIARLRTLADIVQFLESKRTALVNGTPAAVRPATGAASKSEIEPLAMSFVPVKPLLAEFH